MKMSLVGKIFIVMAALTMIVPAAWGDSVIVMVPDGCATSIQTLTRMVYGGPLALDGMAAGQIETKMANSMITGSAAAATAFATGEKTTARFLGIGPRPDDNVYGDVSLAYKPLLSVLEAAKQAGINVGLVSTSRVTHATPAAYTSHVLDRGWDNQIMEQMVYNDIDVVFGGGKRHLLPGSGCPNEVSGGRRSDCENLLDELIARGYTWVDNRDEMLAATAAPVWGLFASSHMKADIDNQYYGTGEPTLAEMTEKAIDLLSGLGGEFLLMVEGSQVDWAGHANDPIHMVTDMKAFDDAVGVAKNKADTLGNVVLHVFPDHNTGALSLGNRSSNSGSAYTSITLDDMIGPLAGMQISAWSLSLEIGDDMSNKNLKSKIEEFWGIKPTKKDCKEIKYLVKKKGLSLDYAIGEVISKNYTYFGWTSHGHTGEDMPFWSYYSFNNMDNQPFGHYDNTELASLAAEALGVTLTKDAAWVDAIDSYGTDASIDKSDPENPVLVINDEGIVYKFPADKDLLYIDDVLQDPPMDGVTVYSPAAEWCVSDDGSVSSAKNIGDCSGTTFVKSTETFYIPRAYAP
jgi:alkaline phosphatase